MSPPRGARYPFAAFIVICGSCLLSALYYSQFVYQANYLPSPSANYLLASLAAILTASLDSLKPRFMKVAADHWRERRRRQAIAPGIMAFLLALISLIAVDGMLLKLRHDGTSGTSNVIAQWERTSAALTKAQGELKALAPSRPVAEITAAMGKVPIDVQTLRRTNHCQPDQITREDSRKACLPLMELHQEQARANRKEQLERDVATALIWLDANPRPASADPQIELYARFSGQSEGTVALLIVMLVGFVLELCALFGPALLTPRAPETPVPSDPVRHSEPIELVAEAVSPAPVVRLPEPKLIAFQPKRARVRQR